jgi:hypothetical protein
MPPIAAQMPSRRRRRGPPARGRERHLEALRGLLERIERAGTSIPDLVCHDRPPIPQKTYPSGAGVLDPATGCSFGYHIHEGIPDEVGHFHTLRWTGRKRVHLAGISMGADGWPRALFTTNLWAQHDDHRPAEELKRDVRRFCVTEGRRHVLVTRFINLIFRAFRPEIERLQDDKARRIAALRRAAPTTDVLEDRQHHVLSRVNIDARMRHVPSTHHTQGGTRWRRRRGRPRRAAGAPRLSR